jgi:DNA-binding PadR family transcriptional regulator
MSMKHVVLGILAKGESHGYRIREEFDQLLIGFRPTEPSRIYALLADLEHEGLVCSRLEPTPRGRVRKMYQLTQGGRKHHQRWSERPVACTRALRRPLLVKLAIASRRGDLDRAIWQAELALRQRILARLEKLQDAAGGVARLSRVLRQRDVLHLEVEVRLLAEILARADASRDVAASSMESGLARVRAPRRPRAP